MNYLDLYPSYPDRSVTSAWNSQLKYAKKDPSLNEALRRCGDELFARFAGCYADLRALPRGARRRLQRRLVCCSDFAEALPKCLRQDGRTLHHRMAWSLAGAALLLALGQGVAAAATITVTTNDPRIVSDGQCSLIEAINNANNDAATHADCPAGSGADTIVLPASANLTLSAVDNTTFFTGLPAITSRITIEGNGATIARQVPAPGFSVMVVTNFGDLTLHHLTLSGSVFYAGLRNYGTASIKDSVISGNSEGGVFNRGTLTIDNSSISDNQVPQFYYYAAGGVTNRGTLIIENSTISGNGSRYGGGIVNYNTLTIENSTISGNMAPFSGGGLINRGTATIQNSTISGNTASQSPSSGGGVVNYGSVTFSHTLIAGNRAAASPEIQNGGPSCSLNPSRCRVIANNFNLLGANGNSGITGFTPGPTDITPSVSLAQIIGPLRNNGGPTQTHALVAGSPAIDAGNPNGCLTQTDQRGLPRAFDGNRDGSAVCDIGAFELNAQDLGTAISISDAIVIEGNSGTVTATF